MAAPHYRAAQCAGCAGDLRRALGSALTMTVLDELRIGCVATGSRKSHEWYRRPLPCDIWWRVRWEVSWLSAEQCGCIWESHERQTSWLHPHLGSDSHPPSLVITTS